MNDMREVFGGVTMTPVKTKNIDRMRYRGEMSGADATQLEDKRSGDVFYRTDDNQGFYLFSGRLWKPIDTSTGGADGDDGITPHIGENGNWFIGDTDTGVKAKAESGVYIGSDEAPPGAVVQIDPNGETFDVNALATKKYVDDAIAAIDIPTGGGGGEWETVFELTTTEEVSDIRSAMLTEIPNIGVFTNASEMQVICYMPKNEKQETRGRLQIGIYHGGGYYVQNLISNDKACSNISADGYGYAHCWVIPSRGSFVETIYRTDTQVTCNSKYDTWDFRKNGDINETFVRGRCCFRFNTTTVFPVGTVVQIRVR